MCCTWREGNLMFWTTLNMDHLPQFQTVVICSTMTKFTLSGVASPCMLSVCGEHLQKSLGQLPGVKLF